MSADLAWTALEWPSLEHVMVSDGQTGFRADSQLVLALDGLATVSYRVECDTRWRVTSLMIKIASAASAKTVELAAAGDGHWFADGQAVPELDGCIDVDISCTPLTNTLPIRRLSWSPGQGRDIDVVYVSVPALDIRPARQRYTMLARNDDRGEALFRYESDSFSADLPVDADGFVTDYPGLWRRVEPAKEAA